MLVTSTPGSAARISPASTRTASASRSVSPANVSHYDATPALDIYGGVEGADLGYVSAQISKRLPSLST